MNEQISTQQKTTKTISHSDQEILQDFKAWLSKWNSDIVSHDDIENQMMILEKFMRGIAIIENLLTKSDQKVMIKARGNLISGSDEANEKEVLAMIENQKKPWYKNLQNISHDLTYLRSIFQNIYEIKNRRSYECFQLRAEVSRLRIENEKLKSTKL